MSLPYEVKHPAAKQDILQHSFSCYSAPGESCQPFQVFLLGVTNLPRVINDIDLTEGTQELLNYCRSHIFLNQTFKKNPTHKHCRSQAFSYILIPQPLSLSSLVQQGTRKWFKFKHLLYIYI